jgi:hypothetical protein
MLFVGTYSPSTVNVPSVETQNGSGFDPDADENEGARQAVSMSEACHMFTTNHDNDWGEHEGQEG